MQTAWDNILLIAGSTRNVGKTTLACKLVEANSSLSPVAIKISHHFDQPTEGLKLISETKDFQLFEETNRNSRKDSSRYLQHGAKRSFFIQANNESLEEAFISLMPFLEPHKPIIIESARLQQYIQAGIFCFVHQKDINEKPSTRSNMKIADVVIYSDGKKFSPSYEKIRFDCKWIIDQ